MLRVYEKVLTEKQKSELTKGVNVKDFLNQMSLPDMESDTDLTPLGKKQYAV